MAEALDDVRSELRRLGYLDHGYQRSFLQDALKPQRPLPALLRLAARVAVAGGTLLAAIASLALALTNGSLAVSPFDLVPLFFHLLPVAAVSLGVTFLALAGLLVLALRLTHVRRYEIVSFLAALLVGVAGVASAVWGSQELWRDQPISLLALFAAAAVAGTYGLIKVMESGLVSLGVRLTAHAPDRRLFSRRSLAAALGLALCLLSLPAFLAVGRGPAPAPHNLPMTAGQRVLVVGVDGVLPAELDYLLARAELPALAHLAGRGVIWRTTRPAAPPASFWTSIATGLPAAKHGVVALDSFRPAGLAHPLARNGPLRWHWQHVARPLGLAEYRPLLDSGRRAFTFWELASRGGEPVVAINWWSTFPAEPLPGWVVAHGAYQLLAEGAAGAVAGQGERDLAALARELGATTTPGPLAAPLAARPAPVEAELLARAILPDRVYLELLRCSLDLAPRAAALYLAGPDLAAAHWPGGGIGFADLVRASLVEVDGVLAAAEGFTAVVVVVDPGRRGGTEGRVMAAGPFSCQPGSGAAEVSPEAVSSAVFRLLGLPQSRELPPPPAGCLWPAPADEVESFGERLGTEAEVRGGDEYLKSLRSLGYL